MANQQYGLQQQYKNKTQNMNTGEQQSVHPNRQQPNHTHKLGNKQFALYLKSQQRLSTLIYNIEKYLSNFQPFYYNAFLSHIKGKDLDTLELLLTEQYNRLVSGKSFLHKINNAVFSRKKCLEKIKRDLTKVQTVLTMFKKAYFRKARQEDNVYIQYTQEQGYTSVEIDTTIEHSIRMISNLFVDMGRLRDMSLYIIQTIHRWRVAIQQWMDRCQNHSRVDFYVRDSDDENSNSIRVYDLVQQDTDFLWQSRLSQHIWMQFKRDPLIIRNVVNVSQRKQKEILQKYFVQILYPGGEQIVDKTIKAIEMLNHVYKPKQLNLYEQQEKLIQNYLGLERKNNEQIGFQMDDNDDNARAVALLSKSQVSKGSRIKKSVSQSKITVKKQFRNQIEADNKKWQQNLQFQSPYANKSPEKLNQRGWIFGKQLKKPASERIRQIIKKHQVEMTYLKNHKGIIKPFTVANLSEKKSIALAYLSQKNNVPIKAKEDGWIYSEDEAGRRKRSRANQVKNIASQGQQNKFESQIYIQKQKTEVSNRKMYQSLVKINNIIEQDPKQHQNDQETPKAKPRKNEIQSKQQRLKNIKNRFFLNKRDRSQKAQQKQKEDLSKTINKKDTQREKQKQKQRQRQKEKQKEKEKQVRKIYEQRGQIKSGRKLVESGIKINSIFHTHDQKNQDINLEDQIEVEEEETPLNFKQFFEVFRADTKEKVKNQSRVVNQMVKSNLRKSEVKQLGGSLPVRKAIDKKRQQFLKSAALLPYFTQSKKQKKNPNKSLSKSKSQASETSFKSYTKIQAPNPSPLPPPPPAPTQYLTLKTKQITKDMIPKYIRHLCSQVPLSSQSFTSYHTTAYQAKMMSILQDCTVNSIIFDIDGQKDGKIGQAIVVETLSTTLKMRYSIEFLNVTKFQYLVVAVCRIAQELLSTSPCEEVVFKLVEDKVDPVSTHFISLIDDPLKNRAEKFSFFHILQKSILGLSNQSLYERVYVLQAKKKNHIKQAISERYSGDWRKRVAGSNYRSLVFEVQCVGLTSNFKLRSENLNKATVEIYKQQSIGILYVLLLQKIITKYHLKQLKVASLSVNDADETTGLVKKSPFLRSIFYGLLELIKKSGEQQKGANISEWVRKSITKFTSMTDLLNYLSYKQYDRTFKFDFLAESRFILNHQLTFSEVNLSASLDFVLENSSNMLLINNHHNFPIQELARPHSSQSANNSFSEQGSTGYLLPTTQDHLKLFVMSGKQYLNCSDSLDLYSYLQLLFRQSTIKEKQNIKQIVIPDLTKRKLRVNAVKMYDGFLRLFPEREFYSGSMIRVRNLWENFYPNAVISKPSNQAIIIDYPIITGFYDSLLEMPIVSYLLKQEK